MSLSKGLDWIILNQLGRRNLTKETQSYLKGLQYEREKKKQGTNNQYVQSEKGNNCTFQPSEYNGPNCAVESESQCGCHGK